MAEDQSTVARHQTARENEEQVLAENALLSERLVSGVRLITLPLLGALPPSSAIWAAWS